MQYIKSDFFQDVFLSGHTKFQISQKKQKQKETRVNMTFHFEE